MMGHAVTHTGKAKQHPTGQLREVEYRPIERLILLSGGQENETDGKE